MNISRQVNSALFLTRVIFTMLVFHCGMSSLCPGIGDTTQIWGGTLKKLCTQLQNRVGAYGTNERKNNVHKETINGKLRPVFAARLQGY